MSALSNSMRPASGAISPAIWPISVVLPAPFGPMMACNSPRRTSSTILSEATTPPKRLVRPAMRSSASARAKPRQHATDATAAIDRDQQQDRAEDDVGVLGDAG